MSNRSDHGLSISVAESAEGVFVVALVGDLDIASAAELPRTLADLGGNPRTRVVVDVSRLEFVDSSGLHALVTGARAIEANDGSIVVASAPREIARAFEFVRLADSVEVESSLEEALARARADADAEQIGR